ncbi:FAD-dependent oxidoreductase [Agrobacterium larrymoorei]|uniref:FAD/NAD(P)-dependent oxidoreductase n=1 Tax=Agrobacterium larrymoorei TaxID=160699 RepID=UPI001571D9D4|nr:NAD(P)/FAD-dependent oxidoreductase [Agrobacterium larrymoorei]NTJ45330.1 FAD-dependent oxidoreductase [Agrobacterium larrymoorei]
MTDLAGKTFDLLIVGAGPAGLAAATEAAGRGLSVGVFDENPLVGGQIYRNVSGQSLIDRDILGPDYFGGSRLVAEALSSGATFYQGSTVWMIERPEGTSCFAVGVQREGIAEIVAAERILIATGALERPFPIKGWTLPGVLTAGAAQTMLKASGAVPSGRVVLAGSGPLLYLLAAQFLRASAAPDAILDTTPRRNWLRALPHLPEFMLSGYARKGISLLAEVRRSTQVITNVTHLEAVGPGRLDHVLYVSGGESRRLEADVLLLHQGVVPQVNLAMATECEHTWNEERLAFEPRLNKGFHSTVAGLYIAGDSVGISGAIAAEAAGRIVGLHVASDLGRLSAVELDRASKAPRSALKKALRGRRFIDALYRPGDRFRMPPDDVVVCRCEEVKAGDVRAAAIRGAQGPNQTKTFLRTGMGPCQGRLCGLTITEILACQSQKRPSEIGYFHIRNPVKPITLGTLAALKSEGETTRLF